MNGYNLTRNWYNFKFENPDKCRHVHSDLYFYILDQWNRLGQKEKFGLPTSYTMEVMGIRSRISFYSALNDLINWGFIKEVEKAKNQNTSRIISIVACKKRLQALDQATIQAAIQADVQADVQATIHIDKQQTIEQENNKQENNKRLPTKKVGLPKNEIVGKEKSLYSEFVAVWFDNWKDYVFTAKDGSKIKSLINKLKLFAKKNNVEPTDAELLKYWEIIIQKMPDFYKGKDLSVVDSKINEIVNEIKNKQHGNSSKYA